MPMYDYYSEKTGEHKEVFHGMNESPEVLDTEGNIMKMTFLPGHGGFKMGADGTRKMTVKQRYGHKKQKDSQSTPSESAMAKAEKIVAEVDAAKNTPTFNPDNPYAGY